MFKNNLKIAWRNLLRNKTSSFINIGGLAVGMAVAILIGLWVWDELSFNKSFANYDRIAHVMQSQTFNGDIRTQTAVPYLMGDELKRTYGSNFKYISMASWINSHILSVDDKKITQIGNYAEPQMTEMLSLKMLAGTRSALADNHSIILAASTAKALFGNEDALNKIIKIDNQYLLKVAGVYEDLPYNSDFKGLSFIAPWQLYIDSSLWPEKQTNPWRRNAYQTFVQIADNVDMNSVSTKIKDVKLNKVQKADALFKPVVFLQPMRKWHLYSQFKNGINTGGRIEFVWLFGIIGLFVLLLACINFMNLSTARSEKRAKEVGIRKAIGSLRSQLINQFFSESLIVALFAFLLSLLFVQLSLSFFNDVAGKKISILWANPIFWLFGIIFILITGFIAGSYPALYLSSFKPVKVLKGAFRVGSLAAIPRKVLVVVQFSVSIILIIGTVIVFRQIEFAKNRDVGYDRNQLVMISMFTNDIHDHFDAVRNELKSTGVVSEMAESSSPTTYVGEIDNGFDWNGKSPAVQGDFGVVFVTPEYGKTIDWQLSTGRNFSKDFGTDSSGIILNETAVTFMNLKHPVGETIKWDDKNYHVIGVIKDMVMQSPYEPVSRTVFVWDKSAQNIVNVKIASNVGTHEAMEKIEATFKKYSPSQPFEYQFIDKEYEKKFGDEVRIGKLASSFAILAIFISCLGLFGMASFMAEQRTKEIGVRKVLGATVFNVWQLLSKDFIVLIIVSLLIAVPIAYYFMHNWLQHYQYRTAISWWIFVMSGIGALIITLLTISFQAIKAAVANPVKSLRTE